MDSTVVLLVALVLCFDAFVILFIVRRKAARTKNARAAVSEVAGSGGWSVLPVHGRDEIFRLEGRFESGVSWKLIHSRCRRGRNASRYATAVWSTGDCSLADSIIALGPGIGGGFAEGVDLNHRLIRLALIRMFDPDISDALSKSTVIVPDDNSFSRHYAIFSDDRDRALRFVAPPIAGVLTAWAEETNKGRPPVIALWKEGMTVKLFGDIRTAERLSEMITLCETVAYRAADIGR